MSASTESVKESPETTGLTTERYPLLLFGGENFLVRSEAIREVIKGLPEFRVFEIALQIFPTFLSDIGYRIFSKLRAPLFGKWHHCRVPLEEDKDLYVE